MNKSKKLAFGGIVSALSLISMLLTGVFPFAEYALPALSGILLIAIVIEFNRKTAYIAYAVVAVLSLIVAPVKESAILFVALFGYYPILKSRLEQVKSHVIEWVIKLSLFNVTVLLAYFAMISLFGMSELLEGIGGGYKYGVLIMLLIGNGVFVIYDIAVSRVVDLYCRKIRTKIKF